MAQVKEKINTAIGIYVSIDTKSLRELIDKADAHKKTDITIKIDDAQKDFSLEEFKRCLGF